MNRPHPIELAIAAIALLAIGVAVTAWDATYVVAPLVQRLVGTESARTPTPMHNLRTMLTGVFAIVLAASLLRRRPWARRTVVATGWMSALVIAPLLTLAPHLDATRFTLNLGALIPFMNAPFLLVCQLLSRTSADATPAVALAAGVALPAAAALTFSTARIRRAFDDAGMHVATLVRRELGAFFLSPIAYIVGAVFLFISGVYFSFFIFQARECNLKGPLFWMGWVLLIMIPFLTMRLVARERRSGTIEMLLTTPVTDTEVIASKFLGALVFFGVMLAPTGVYCLVLRRYGTPDLGPILTGYIGVFLLGAYLIAFGLMISALCANQITAGAVSMVAGLAIAVLSGLVDPKSVLSVGESTDRIRRLAYSCVKYVGMIEHLDPFLKGVFDQKDFFFYIAFTFLWLFLAVRALESRKWRY